MAEHYVGPWAKTMNGPWGEAKERSQRPCHYCGKPAAMTEPGKPWKAHKVCAEDDDSEPLGAWDETEASHAEPRAIGCGVSADGQVSGRACGGKGTELSCGLCPKSPTYWRVT